MIEYDNKIGWRPRFGYGNPTIGSSFGDSPSSSPSTLNIYSPEVDNISNRILVAFISIEGGGSVSSVTFKGSGLTKAVQSVYGSKRTEAWYLLNPGENSAGSPLVFNLSGTISAYTGYSVTIYNAKQQAPEATATNGSTSSVSSISANITTLSDGAMILDGVCWSSVNSVTYYQTTEAGVGAKTTSQARHGSLQYIVEEAPVSGSGNRGLHTQKIKSSSGSTSMSQQVTNSGTVTYACVAFEPYDFDPGTIKVQLPTVGKRMIKREKILSTEYGVKAHKIRLGSNTYDLVSDSRLLFGTPDPGVKLFFWKGSTRYGFREGQELEA